jgi:hypothetical protein
MLKGNTIKLKANFVDFDNVEVDPLDLVFKVYDKQEKTIYLYKLTEANKIKTGEYEVLYTLPNNQDEIIYEFSGELDGVQIVGRSNIKLTFYR